MEKYRKNMILITKLSRACMQVNSLFSMETH